MFWFLSHQFQQPHVEDSKKVSTNIKYKSTIKMHCKSVPICVNIEPIFFNLPHNSLSLNADSWQNKKLPTTLAQPILVGSNNEKFRNNFSSIVSILGWNNFASKNKFLKYWLRFSSILVDRVDLTFHRGSGTLSYLTKPPSRHQTLTDTSSEKEKQVTLIPYSQQITKCGIVFE